MQTRAAYRNPSQSNSRNSNPPFPCRQPLVSPAKNSLSSQLADPKSFEPPTVQAFADISQLVSDLDGLVEMGLLETYVDEFRIRRYRPADGRRVG